MYQEYKEEQFTPATLSDEIIAHTENVYRDRSNFIEVLSSLDFNVETRTPSPEAIEQLRTSDIDLSDRMDILLTALGEKPASAIILVSEEWQNGEEEKEVSEDESATLLEAIQSFGLHVYVYDNPPSETQPGLSWKRRTFSISLSDDNAKILDKTFWSTDTVEQLVAGKALGYPDTAVAAFVAQEGMIPVFEESYETEEDKAFTQLRLTSENIDTEMQTIRRWAQAIKNADPLLYDEVIQTLGYRL